MAKKVKEKPNKEIPQVVEEVKVPRRSLRARTVYFLFSLAIIILLFVSLLLYFKYRDLLQRSLSRVTGQSSDAELIDNVSKIAVLPQNEAPKIATVSDISKLSHEPFFADAQNGDKVLIYPLAHKAFIYRQSIKKIINIGPVNAPVGSLQSSPDISPALAPKPRVVILNGTKRAGLTKTAQSRIQKEQVEIVDRDNAKKDTYEKTLVVDVSGKNKDEAQRLASLLGGQADEMPSGESAQKDTDIVIILGSDFAAE